MIVTKYKIQLVKESARNYPDYDRKLFNPEEVSNLLFSLEVDREPVEVFYLIMLDRRLKLIGVSRLATGTSSQAVFDPKSILQTALLANADTVMIAHNHPSGDPKPSSEDITATEKLAEAFSIFGIDLLDHLIIGHEGSYRSLRELGYM